MGNKRPTSSPMPSSVYTVREICQIFRIPQSTAYLEIERGNIPSIKIGRQVRVPREAIDKLLASAG